MYYRSDYGGSLVSNVAHRTPGVRHDLWTQRVALTIAFLQTVDHAFFHPEFILMVLQAINERAERRRMDSCPRSIKSCLRYVCTCSAARDIRYQTPSAPFYNLTGSRRSRGGAYGMRLHNIPYAGVPEPYKIL